MRRRTFFANDGDCLLLTSDAGKNVLVDGGHYANTFRRCMLPSLRPAADPPPESARRALSGPRVSAANDAYCWLAATAMGCIGRLRKATGRPPRCYAASVLASPCRRPSRYSCRDESDRTLFMSTGWKVGGAKPWRAWQRHEDSSRGRASGPRTTRCPVAPRGHRKANDYKLSP
jgi:hypothetical protein